MSGWVICPFLNNWPMTRQALQDALDQTVRPQVLAIGVGIEDDIRADLEAWAEKEPRLHPWTWIPGMPSLSATWNTALNFVWSQAGDLDALVINNDVRLRPELYASLRGVMSRTNALFVSAVGRRAPDIEAISEDTWQRVIADLTDEHFPKGGPDFSCFLISEQGHVAYPFDEGFVPAYCEDVDSHRRYLLGGDGERIFGVNFPYLHYAAGTINAEPEKAAEWAKRLATSRAHYERKWGGEVHSERFTVPFDPTSDQDGVTNPELQAGYVGRLPDVIKLSSESLGDA